MRKLLLTSLAALVVLSSCTIKENRTDCPAYLDLAVTRQADSVFHSGRAWCYLFDGSGTVSASDPLSGMNGRDTLLSYTIRPKRSVTAITSNREVVGGKVTVTPGSEMCELYSYRKDITCFQEQVTDRIDRQDKQFCLLTLVLSDEALHLASGLKANVKGNYNGLSYPLLKATEGQFAFTSAFADNGTATVRLPRQGGPGLFLRLVQPGGFVSEYDLYEGMVSLHYDWYKDSLDDLTLKVNLNTVTGNLVIEDWKMRRLDGWEF